MALKQSWKDRYLQEVEHTEAQEKRWQEERNALERMLVRTSLAAEGQSPDLDDKLSQLRDFLRSGSGNLQALRQLQEQIEGQLGILDEGNVRSLDRLRDSFERLLSVARQHPLFGNQRKDLARLGKAMRKPATARDAPPEWLLDLAQLLEQALSVDPEAAGRSPGLLGKLLGPRRSRNDCNLEDTADYGGSALVDRPPETELAPEVPEDASQRQRIAQGVSELLEQMLSQVSLEVDAEKRARHLQASLGNNSDWDQLREGLRGVAELVVAAVTRTQREFEAFLQRLDERLAALQQHFAEQACAQQGRLSAADALDKDLREELQCFGERIEASDDLQELKTSVSLHVASISKTMEAFRAREGERERTLAQQLRVMQEKLAAMEAHSEQVKEQLRAERARAHTDMLTQLPNREAWEERLSFEFCRWQRYCHPVTLCVLDIDHFKRVNDSYGHKAGDRVIELVAKALRERLRNTDFAARYGGEEYVVLLPETSLEDARRVIDQLRDHVAGLPFHFRGEPVTITFSAGLAMLAEGDDEESVFNRADKALYRAKEAGRNRTVTG